MNPYRTAPDPNACIECGASRGFTTWSGWPPGCEQAKGLTVDHLYAGPFCSPSCDDAYRARQRAGLGVTTGDG